LFLSFVRPSIKTRLQLADRQIAYCPENWMLPNICVAGVLDPVDNQATRIHTVRDPFRFVRIAVAGWMIQRQRDEFHQELVAHAVPNDLKCC
jgi:hypothetical protein